MSVSDVVRQAVILWRAHVGDRQKALEGWSDELASQYGPRANLTAQVTDDFSVELEIDGQVLEGATAEGVFESADRLQVWVGDQKTDARAFTRASARDRRGRDHQSPLAGLPALGAVDVDEV